MAEQEQGRRLSLGFIGGGPSSAMGQTHFAASQLDGRWRLEAGVFSTDEQTNRATADTWRMAPDRVYTGWRDLILAERQRLDAVAVLTPAAQRYDIVQALLKAGIPVICERALVSNLNDVRSLLAQYNAAKHFVAVTSSYSGYPMVRELRRRIRDGEFGKLHQLHIEIPQDGLAATGDGATAAQGRRVKDDFIPAICLDLGVHLHHLAYFLSGEEPEMVNAEFNTFSPYRDAVDNVMLWLHYASGMSANFWISQTALGRRSGLRIRVFGEKGGAEWFQADAERLHVATANGARLIIDRAAPAGPAAAPGDDRLRRAEVSGLIEAIANLYADCADALEQWRARQRHASPSVFGMQHASNGLSLFHAARLSSSRRRWERLQATGPYRDFLLSRSQR